MPIVNKKHIHADASVGIAHALQTVNIQFALVSFLLFLGEKVTAHCIDVVHQCQPI